MPETMATVEIGMDEDLRASFDALRSELETARAEREQQAVQIESMSTQLAAEEARRLTLESEARQERYGRMAADWYGLRSDHVALLEHLAATAPGGEEGLLFKAVVQRETAHAAQLRAGNILREIGADGDGGELTDRPDEEAVRLTQRRAAERGITYSEAAREIMAERPDLQAATRAHAIYRQPTR